MRIHEYQAKEVFARFGLPIPRGEVADTPRLAADIAARLGGKVVLKAQVQAGGRGKAGGVRVAADSDEARRLAESLIGMTLVTPQTGPEGKKVRHVLVEEAVESERELYLGIAIDRTREAVLVMASPQGGMDIEAVAARTPGSVFREYAEPGAGLASFQARRLAIALGLAGEALKPGMKAILGLFRIFEQCDASLAEINPLVLTRAGSLVALDAKLVLDDNALPRHPELRALRDPDEESPLEVQAEKVNLNYVKLDGHVGCMVNGAGLAMATMDIIKLAGGSPANFLDVGGGVSEEAVSRAFKILVADKDVRAALVNIFGGIVRCDLVANGIVKAAREVGLKIPLVVRLKGTNVEQGRKILAESGLAFQSADTMKEAADKVVPLAARAGRA